MSDVASTHAGASGADAAPAEVPGIGSVRRRRSELKAAMVALEESISASRDDSTAWLTSVTDRLDALGAALRNHVTIHEGAESFHAEILRAQPHLASRVAALQREHRRLEAGLTQAVDAVRSPGSSEAVEEVRGRAAELLQRLTSHRRRGADLIWEAFNADLGGEH